MAGQGQIYSFSDTLTTRRSIANVISIIDPRDTPMVSFLGTKNQGRHKILDFPNHKYSWLEDTLRIRTATVSGAATDGADTTLSVAAGHGIRFKPGDVWMVDATGELVWVDAVSTDALTIVRGWGDTNGGAIADAGALTYQFSARLEGDDSDPQFWTNVTEQYNYSQIFHAEIKVSGSEQHATTRYGIADQYKHQINKLLGGAGAGDGKQGRAGDLLIDLENTFFRGQRVQRSSSAAGGMGGFKTFVTTNVVNANGATLDIDMLEDLAMAAWAAGGMPDTIVCNGFNKRLISSWFSASVRTTRTDRTGGITVNEIETEFGNYDIMLNRRCPSNEVYFICRDKVGWLTLRDWAVEPMAVNGDYRKDQIIGEFGFIVENEKSHGYITNLAVGA